MGCHAQKDFLSSAARYEPREESSVDTVGDSGGPCPLECILVANAVFDLRRGSLHNLSNSETLCLEWLSLVYAGKLNLSFPSQGNPNLFIRSLQSVQGGIGYKFSN